MTPISRRRGILKERIAHLHRRRIHSPRNSDVREVVRLRAGDACEYCLLPTAIKFHIEHIIPPDLWANYTAGRIVGVPLQPGRRGPNHIDNYAWACPFCNETKSQRVSHGRGRWITRFFDPRYDHWPDCFTFLSASGYIYIVGSGRIGQITAGPNGLDFNAGGVEGPLGARHLAILRGDYPPAWARIEYGI